MNWAYIIIGGATLEVALLMLVYHLTARRSDGAIKALESHNKWLKEQLDRANDNAPDALVERLSKRSSLLESELKQLSKDYEANQEIIKTKESELETITNLLEGLQDEIKRQKTAYDELSEKIEVCPYCHSALRSKSSWGELHFHCGYGEVNGSIYYFCPTDDDRPRLDEFDFMASKVQGKWLGFGEPITDRAQHMASPGIAGDTEQQAIENAMAEYQKRFEMKEAPECVHF